MGLNEFWTNLSSGVLSILGIFAMILANCLYGILKKYLMQKLSIAESIGEAQERDLLTKFSKEAYNAVEQLNNQGLLDTSKKDAFDKLFKDNFPNVEQKHIDLYREAVVGKANAERLRVKTKAVENEIAKETAMTTAPVPQQVDVQEHQTEAPKAITE